jgi:hypothetical protein
MRSFIFWDIKLGISLYVQITWRYIPAYRTLYNHHSESLKPCKNSLYLQVKLCRAG